MLLEERQKKIVDLVYKNSSMTVQALMEELNASESTVRRDLGELDEKGLLQKVYGGAIARNIEFDSKDVSVNARKSMNHDSKLLIAKKAASLIEEGDFVYLDAGTTTELMIDFIGAHNVVFVTNAFLHAKLLVDRGFKTYILGGQIKMPTEAVVGEEAVLALRKYHFTKGFWGCNAVSLGAGFSTPDVSEAIVKQVSMEQTRERYVLADESKFTKISAVSFADFADCKVITDRIGEEEYRKLDNIIEASA